MAYEEITDAEIDSGSPITEQLMSKLRDNQDFLRERLLGLKLEVLTLPFVSGEVAEARWTPPPDVRFCTVWGRLRGVHIDNQFAYVNFSHLVDVRDLLTVKYIEQRAADTPNPTGVSLRVEGHTFRITTTAGALPSGLIRPEGFGDTAPNADLAYTVPPDTTLFISKLNLIPPPVGRDGDALGEYSTGEGRFLSVAVLY